MLDIRPVHRLDVEMRLGAVAGVPAAAELVADVHPLPRLGRRAPVPEMTQGHHDLVRAVTPDQHVVPGQCPQPPRTRLRWVSA